MNDTRFTAWIAIIVVLGTLAMFGLLSFCTIPPTNEKTVDMIVTAWLTVGFSVVLKRLFDGTASADKKNETIAAQAQTIAAQVAPAAPPEAIAP